jgi:hypothetical protein
MSNFSGHTGFRFPVAYYPTKEGVKATDLHKILWDCVLALIQWGFTVEYILQVSSLSLKIGKNLICDSGIKHTTVCVFKMSTITI